MDHNALILIIRIALVVVILIGMIVILMGINHYMLSDRTDTNEEADKLKDDVENSESVISRHSLFHHFLPKSLKNHRS